MLRAGRGIAAPQIETLFDLMSDIADAVRKQLTRAQVIPPDLRTYVKQLATAGEVYREEPSSNHEKKHYIVLKIELKGKPLEWTKFIHQFPKLFAQQTGACKTRPGMQSNYHNTQLLYFEDSPDMLSCPWAN